MLLYNITAKKANKQGAFIMREIDFEIKETVFYIPGLTSRSKSISSPFPFLSYIGAKDDDEFITFVSTPVMSNEVLFSTVHKAVSIYFEEEYGISNIEYQDYVSNDLTVSIRDYAISNVLVDADFPLVPIIRITNNYQNQDNNSVALYLYCQQRELLIPVGISPLNFSFKTVFSERSGIVAYIKKNSKRLINSFVDFYVKASSSSVNDSQIEKVASIIDIDNHSFEEYYIDNVLNGINNHWTVFVAITAFIKEHYLGGQYEKDNRHSEYIFNKVILSVSQLANLNLFIDEDSQFSL